MVRLDQRAAHVLAECRHAPTAGVGDLGQQVMDVKMLQRPHHFVAAF